MTEYNILDEVLDDTDKLAIQMFWDNERQREAVFKCLLVGIYSSGTLSKDKNAFDPKVNFLLAIANRKDMSREDKGKQLENAAEAIAIIETAFSNMSKFRKPEEPKEPKPNEAR